MPLGNLGLNTGMNAARAASGVGLSGILGAVNPWIGAGMGALNAISTIAKLMGRGGQKITATSTQQNMEKTASEIQARVSRGELSPAAAVSALKTLLEQAGQLATSGATDADKAAGTNAINTINQILTNMREAYTNQLNAPYNPTQPIDKNRLLRLGRGRLLGDALGQDVQAAGGPINKAFEPTQNVQGNMGATMGMLRQNFPEWKRGSTIEDALKKYPPKEPW